VAGGGGGLRGGAVGSGRGSRALLPSVATGAGIGSGGGKVDGFLSKLGRGATGRASGASGRACGAVGCMGVLGTTLLVARCGTADVLLLRGGKGLAIGAFCRA
jgi:hypothetical protein